MGLVFGLTLFLITGGIAVGYVVFGGLAVAKAEASAARNRELDS